MFTIDNIRENNCSQLSMDLLTLKISRKQNIVLHHDSFYNTISTMLITFNTFKRNLDIVNETLKDHYAEVSALSL